MNEEDGFLSAIRSAPADDTARLVYADWLDEQPDPTCRSKAEFLRLELRLAGPPEPGLDRVLRLNHLQKLAAQLAPAWLATVSRPKLEACCLLRHAECAGPGRWDRLAPTDAPTVRFCETCRNHAHYCETLDEARAHAAHGHCVAVSPAVVRQPNDLFAPLPTGERIRLTPAMIERLRDAARFGLQLTSVRLAPVPEPAAAPPEPPEWLPQPAADRTRARAKRRTRDRRRRIERENWEEPE